MKQKGKPKETDVKILTAQDFVNVRDIKDKILYTKDNKIFAYVKITPISIDLLSSNEKEQLIKNLSAEISSERKSFKFFAISRPVDISNLINELTILKSESIDLKQKELLTYELKEYNAYALSGEVIERQYFIILWEDTDSFEAEDTLIKRAREFATKFDNCGIQAHLIGQQEIYQFLNLFANPNYAHIENSDYEPAFPLSINMVKDIVNTGKGEMKQYGT